MSHFSVTPGHLAKASASLKDVSAAARSADGSDAIDAARSALPGSASSEALGESRTQWVIGLKGWCDSVSSLAEAIDQLQADADAIDKAVGSVFGRARQLFERP
jgi:hypothetical protein